MQLEMHELRQNFLKLMEPPRPEVPSLPSALGVTFLARSGPVSPECRAVSLWSPLNHVSPKVPV